MEKENKFKVSFAVLTVFALAAIPLFQVSQLASTLGISAYAARTVIDILATASSVYAVVGIVAAVIGGGGIGVAILATAKALVQRYGRAAAAAW